jgi:hypothetical protein
MKLKTNSGNFEPCPEYVGSAVCVDVTPLKTVQTQYGPKEKFRFVFEVDLEREDGSRFCVWSQPFTPSYHENSALRPFTKTWFGRELSMEEQKNFDLEDLIGRTAHLTVIHEHSDGEVYANIALIQPDKSAEPLQPSGKYVRVKDRPAKDGAGAGQAGGGYQRAQQPAKDAGDLGATKIHVGRCKGLEVRDLAPEQVQALIANWMPTAKSNPKPTADDRRLIAALEWWESNQAAQEDNVPY